MKPSKIRLGLVLGFALLFLELASGVLFATSSVFNTYDAAGRLIRQGNGIQETVFLYDNSGNLLQSIIQNLSDRTTSTQLDSSPNPSTFGQAVTFTATVNSGTVPTGTVTFREGSTFLGTGTLNNFGVATLTLTNLSVGSHVITGDFPASALKDASTGSVPQTVTKTTPVITWISPSPMTYGTELGGNQLSATANTAGTFTYTPPAGTILNAGNGQTLSVVFNPADTVGFNSVTQTVTINVFPHALNITADDKNIAQGSPLPTLTATFDGLVNGDTPESLDSPVVLATTATADSPAGAYPITASGAADPNYTIGFVPGTLRIGGVGGDLESLTFEAGTDHPIFDLAGTYEGTLTTAEGTIDLLITLTHAPNGQLAGAGTYQFNGTPNHQGNVTPKGKINIVDGAATSQLTLTLKSAESSGKITGLVTFNVENQSLDGDLEISLDGSELNKIDETATGASLTSTETDPDRAMTGRWQLSLAPVFDPKGKSLGTGQVTLSNQRQIHFNNKGKFSKGKQTFKLTGVDTDKGNKLTVSGPGTINSLTGFPSVTGKVLGQPVAVPAP